MPTVAVVDYGLCNMDSVARAVEQCGAQAVITNDPAVVRGATHIILPGVGSFAEAMQNLRAASLDVVLRERVLHAGVPFLGICLGMQLLATKGWEGGETDGLGFIEGEVRLLQTPLGDERIPHVGWNEVAQEKPSPLWQGIPSGKDFYFVHSYHLSCRDDADVIGRTPYCGGFVSVVQRERIFGTQFHPEKSQKMGRQLLRNFLSCTSDSPC